MEVKLIGLDIAKRVFQVHGVDEAGEALSRGSMARPGARPLEWTLAINARVTVEEAVRPKRSLA